MWVGVWFSSRLYNPFGKGPGQHIIRCLKNKKCENERTIPSVHRERLGLTLKNYKITGKIWHLLEENSRRVRVRVLHALIDQDEVDILRGLPEGSRFSPTLFGICVAELILELRAKFPLLQFPQITSLDDLNWIGAFLYVDDMVLIARSPAQLQSMIDAYQDGKGSQSLWLIVR